MVNPSASPAASPTTTNPSTTPCVAYLLVWIDMSNIRPRFGSCGVFAEPSPDPDPAPREGFWAEVAVGRGVDLAEAKSDVLRTVRKDYPKLIPFINWVT